MAYDVVIRGGTIVDGTGGEPTVADVAVSGESIAAVGRLDAPGLVEIEAPGLLVTPGFIDAHSHLDGNVTWEHRLKPNSGHGITTTVFGNCGVGFAPCKPEHREFTVALMEGVEDIPAEILNIGLPWQWESYPEYRRFIAGRAFDMNVTGFLPHSSLRVHVMGRRAIEGEPATEEDIAEMARLTEEAVCAGAAGVGSTRLVGQKTRSGIASPSLHATEAEYLAIAQAMVRGGGGVLQIAPEFNQFPRAEDELAMIIRISAATGIPVVYSLKQSNAHPRGWQRLLELTAEANQADVPVHPMVLGRPTGAIISWESSVHRFSRCPTYMGLADLPLADRVSRLARAETRAAILHEASQIEADHPTRHSRLGHLMFAIGDTPDYEPRPDDSVAVRAEASGIAEAELVYDSFMEREGRGNLLMASGNYTDGSLDPALEMMRFGGSVLGLGDGGAHCTLICDASAPTFMVSYWARDRVLGDRLELSLVIRKLTSEPAALFGFDDRGVLAPGRKADINVIDHGRLRLLPPRMDYDLPGGGKRLVQDAEGYAATLVNGQIVVRHDQPTNALPGRLIGGPK